MNLFTFIPDFNDAPTVVIKADNENGESNDKKNGDYSGFVAKRAVSVVSHNFNGLSYEETQQLLDFFVTQHGRGKVFQIPSWTSDIYLKSDANIGDDFLVVYDGNLDTFASHTDIEDKYTPNKEIWIYNDETGLELHTVKYTTGDKIYLKEPLLNSLAADSTVGGLVLYVRFANNLLEFQSNGGESWNCKISFEEQIAFVPTSVPREEAYETSDSTEASVSDVVLVIKRLIAETTTTDSTESSVSNISMNIRKALVTSTALDSTTADVSNVTLTIYYNIA